MAPAGLGLINCLLTVGGNMEIYSFKVNPLWTEFFFSSFFGT